MYLETDASLVKLKEHDKIHEYPTNEVCTLENVSN